jgi:hypothetical protein
MLKCLIDGLIFERSLTSLSRSAIETSPFVADSMSSHIFLSGKRFPFAHERTVTSLTPKCLASFFLASVLSENLLMYCVMFIAKKGYIVYLCLSSKIQNVSLFFNDTDCIIKI